MVGRCGRLEDGILGELANRVQNWSCNRRQRVVVENCTTAMAPVTSGVLQGLLLCPLLIVYIR